MQLTGKHLVIAHRGASAYAPENTLPAFELAADMNAFGVELDVMYTKDGEIVVSHDWDLVRICGAKGLVHEMTLEELRRHNFAGEFAGQYGHVEIPTLEEVYNLLGPRGLYVNVELKDAGGAFARKVHDIALKCGMRDKVFYSGFDHYALEELLVYDPEAFVAPLFFAQIAQPGAYAHLFGAKAIHPPYEQMLAHPESVAQAHELGVRVHACVSDDPVVIRRLFEIGVDGIITNKPEVALEVANSFQ